MPNFNRFSRRKLLLSLRAVAGVMRRPASLFLALVTAFLVLGILAWLPNIGLLFSLLTGSELSAGDKLMFAWSGYGSLFSNFSILNGLILVIFAVLSGINLALLVYVVSGSYQAAASNGAANAAAVTLAAIGAGCAACGTSFLGPLLGGLAGTASLAFTNTLGAVINLLGIGLIAYSIYRLGIQADSQKYR